MESVYKVKIQMERLKTEGRTCYEIPMGGANARGSLGFLEGYVELMEDLQRIDKKAQYLYHATGTGGTMAGPIGREDASGIRNKNPIHRRRYRREDLQRKSDGAF